MNTALRSIKKILKFIVYFFQLHVTASFVNNCGGNIHYSSPPQSSTLCSCFFDP